MSAGKAEYKQNLPGFAACPLHTAKMERNIRNRPFRRKMLRE
jgi:hypothetical protein